jgi:hypothetical protein
MSRRPAGLLGARTGGAFARRVRNAVVELLARASAGADHHWVLH